MGVKYGVRHYAHYRCYLISGRGLSKLHDWQVVQFPWQLLKEFAFADYAEAAHDRLNKPAPRLRPYQQQTSDMIRTTAPAVEALKQSVMHVHEHELVRQNHLDLGGIFINRLCGEASEENVRFLLEMLGKMNTTDFDDLNLIRKYLRSEP